MARRKIIQSGESQGNIYVQKSGQLAAKSVSICEVVEQAALRPHDRHSKKTRTKLLKPLFGREQTRERKQICPKSERISSMCHPPRYSKNLMKICNNMNSTLFRPGRQNLIARWPRLISYSIILLCIIQLNAKQMLPVPLGFADASLIVGDSAIEIQEMDSGSQQSSQSENQNEPSVILGTSPPGQSAESLANSLTTEDQTRRYRPNTMPGPLPPMASSSVDSSSSSRATNPSDSQSNRPAGYDKAIAGKVVDFELIPAGGHNKAKIKKKKKKKKKEEAEMYKKWGKKKKEEKKAMEKKHKESMKKKKEEGKLACISLIKCVWSIVNNIGVYQQVIRKRKSGATKSMVSRRRVISKRKSEYIDSNLDHGFRKGDN